MRLLVPAVCLVSLLNSSAAQAQVISGGESERGLRPGANVPYDGAPYTQRYSYGLGASFVYINGDARNLWYLDYLDRAKRADKFGYRPPPDPFCNECAEPAPVRPARVGLGWGLFRRW